MIMIYGWNFCVFTIVRVGSGDRRSVLRDQRLDGALPRGHGDPRAHFHHARRGRLRPVRGAEAAGKIHARRFQKRHDHGQDSGAYHSQQAGVRGTQSEEREEGDRRL